MSLIIWNGLFSMFYGQTTQIFYLILSLWNLYYQWHMSRCAWKRQNEKECNFIFALLWLCGVLGMNSFSLRLLEMCFFGRSLGSVGGRIDGVSRPLWLAIILWMGIIMGAASLDVFLYTSHFCVFVQCWWWVSFYWSVLFNGNVFTEVYLD